MTPNRLKVIAVMPAFNAAKTLKRTYEAIPKEIVDEVIMVDDASSDNTLEIAEQIAGLIVIHHKNNRGYGGNQKTCYTDALKRGGDIIIMIHPDFQYDPKYVPDMIAPIINDETDFVMGSRFMNNDPRKDGMDWWRYWGNKFLTYAQNNKLGLKLTEGHSGYRAYSRKALQQVDFHNFSDDFVFDSQMLAALSRNKLRIHEVPIPTRYNSENSSISFTASVRYGLNTLKTLM